jgi:tetratricopeptide (TPR) repeat protein
VIEPALATDPSNQVLIRGLAENRSRAAAVLEVLGRFPEAATEIEAAIERLRPLVASDAANLQYRADLAFAWFRMGDIRRAEGRLREALGWHQRALAVRRDRARFDSAFMFVPWELARSLNTVGELLLEISPGSSTEARGRFEEARDVAQKTLLLAPSFNEMRRQLAISFEGLAMAALAERGPDHADTRETLAQSVATWRDVFGRSVGDRRHYGRLERLERLPASRISSNR